MGLADVSISQPPAGDPDGLLATIMPLYVDVYTEPPYLEGPKEIDEFVDRWNHQAVAPGFRIVLAHDEHSGDLIGFCFGLPLSAKTRWWEGMLDPVDPSVTAEDGHRSFAVIELAVRRDRRRQGIGRVLHDTLLAGRTEERAVLLTRPEPEAAPARAAYAKWGYQTHGRLRPAPEAPVYLALTHPLP